MEGSEVQVRKASCRNLNFTVENEPVLWAESEERCGAGACSQLFSVVGAPPGRCVGSGGQRLQSGFHAQASFRGPQGLGFREVFRGFCFQPVCGGLELCICR